MGKGLIVVAVLLVIVLALGGQYIGVKNTLVAKDQAVKAAWSQVDIVLQHRQGAVGAAFRADSFRQDCRERATGWRDRPAACHRGELSPVEVE
jgi:hypothetical protein